MVASRGRIWWMTGALTALSVLSGCAPQTPLRAPPVEDRGLGAGSFGMTGASVPPATVTPPKPLPGAENAGKPGYYTVKPGDTVRKVAQSTGQTWQDIARWSELTNADLIEVGQVLRVAPPVAVVASSPSSAPPAAPAVTGTPLPPVAQPATPARPSQGAGGDEELAFIWPAPGPLLATFDEAKNKGYDIGGKAGDAVVAAADGRVVYAGAGLRGYGNLIILKHNNTYLTAYAHNQTLLVKEDQNVHKGQKIAEMGSSDSDRVKLHFEIRRQGKPVDPSRYLASR
ncbi:peptidoglycan DD-metalloendopeptidase family protein [Xylophilus sp. GOD-11R]|uniref:peptidoglycan DD-metalloendopeptidase family protein n=1 Tax=Xylophilus sp. GOD-11R TaxID=3089814 RepID=UPI00298CB3C3|nr:peptidoglycan DD-metalloendopeptidase family protein [Xylophilus sp. GOD-11R]WPB59382.1 peptidoglycan DD-metalloendopeptidase family protein [Xylophilus sp. GOD-11R]